MNYPSFKVIEVSDFKGSLSVKGELDKTSHGNEKWIDDECCGTLKNGPIIVWGRWFKEGEMWRFRFEPEEKDKITIHVGQVLSAIDGYWGERAELVLDESITWEMVNFKAKETWDHDHCAICWATISERENTTHYIGNGTQPVCTECFNSYVQKHNLSFIPSGE